MAKPTKKVTKVSSVAKTEQSDTGKVKPLGDRVLVRELKKEGERSVSGIIIPETVGEDRGARKGEVIAVGAGKFDDGILVPMQVRVGDNVLFQWGDKLTIDGEEYEMVNESAILAIIK